MIVNAPIALSFTHEINSSPYYLGSKCGAAKGAQKRAGKPKNTEMGMIMIRWLERSCRISGKSQAACSPEKMTRIYQNKKTP